MLRFSRTNEKTVIQFFQYTVKHVPAYKKFLSAHKVLPRNIKNFSDFQSLVPLMEKDNYLRAYPFIELVPEKKVPPMISASSGSSGKPFYWPRGDEQELAGGKLHERVFREIYKIGSKRTLVIVCFSMGTWIAGSFTAASCRYVARQKGINLSIITPGIEKEDILAALRDLAPNFETVILAGYPPFLMDIVTEAAERVIRFAPFQLKFLFAGENFSETWRANICEAAGIENTRENSVSIYGTADAGALGHETPLTVALRTLAMTDIAFQEALFGTAGFIPSLVQCDPKHIFFESVHGQLAFSTKSGIPLIRYNIKDEGKVFSYEEIVALLKKHGHYQSLAPLIKTWPFPCIALFGRSDVAVTFYALNIYPENIKAGIEGKKFSNLLTGKFVARVETSDNERNQKLTIAFELSKNTTLSTELFQEIQTSLFESLMTLNTEYRKLYNSIKEKALPQIVVLPFGDELFAIRKSKHKWVKK